MRRSTAAGSVRAGVQEEVKSLAPDHLLAPVADEPAFLTVDQEQQVDAMGAAETQNRFGKVWAGRQFVFQNGDVVI